MALALALSITALPPPSRADVGQPDHDNASAAGLQLEAPLNEHESRCTTAARVMQPKVTTKAEGAAAEGEAAAAAMAAGSARPPLLLVLWDVSHLPPLASDKVAGSMDADLLEIEEVLGVRYCAIRAR